MLHRQKDKRVPGGRGRVNLGLSGGEGRALGIENFGDLKKTSDREVNMKGGTCETGDDDRLRTTKVEGERGSLNSKYGVSMSRNWAKSDGQGVYVTQNKGVKSA